MDFERKLSRVRALSDGALVSGLIGSLGASRRAVAEVIAHLGEVEERRLHLLGGYGSLFAYCVSRLGMSEDEAGRRIEVARLARRFPRLFERLAAGHVSLSVAALLKPHLTSANHEALLDAVSSKTVQQAREVLASWFPQPDVLPSLRKLPTPPARVDAAERVAAMGPTPAPATEPGARTAAMDPSPAPPALSPPALPRAAARTFEPLSPERYKLQLTAGAELKRKLELARDLLRHALPSGDMAAILERALDVLLEQTMKRRFAVTRSQGGAPTEPRAGAIAAAPGSDPPSPPLHLDDAKPLAKDPGAEPSPPGRRIPNAVRRIVHARDGGRCTWQGPDGTRCNSRAWLEHDHRIPVGLGGTSQAFNVRPFCRAHNRLAAEQVYGQDTIAKAIARRRSARGRARSSAHAGADGSDAPADDGSHARADDTA